jgi:hypothetical protein
MKNLITIASRFKQLVLPFLALLIAATSMRAGNFSKNEEPLIIGRWDITIDKDGKPTPSWLDVQHSGYHGLIGFFVGDGGSARPISKVNFQENKMSFTIPPQWEKGPNDITVEGTLDGDKLSGTYKDSDGKQYNWVGVRAPSLRRKSAPVWGTPIKLFNGTDTKGWHASGENQWIGDKGILKSPRPGSNLITDRVFNDFKLHVEFRYQKESNSGVYLRGRYEVQVADNIGKAPARDYFGAIYGFLVPSDMMAKAPGEWQSFDITLIGRMVTISCNGKTVITNQEIPGITGGALDSKEGEPGPIMLQGDHGPIDYRNIIITPAK